MDSATAESHAEKGRCSNTNVLDTRGEAGHERLSPARQTGTFRYGRGTVLPPRGMPSPAGQGDPL